MLQSSGRPTEQARSHERAQTRGLMGEFRVSLSVHSANIPCHLGRTGDIAVNTIGPPRILCRGLEVFPTPNGNPSPPGMGFARGVKNCSDNAGFRSGSELDGSVGLGPPGRHGRAIGKFSAGTWWEFAVCF